MSMGSAWIALISCIRCESVLMIKEMSSIEVISNNARSSLIGFLPTHTEATMIEMTEKPKKASGF